MTANAEFTLWPTRPIHVPAFFLALIGAPLVTAAGGFWLFLVPVFAVPFGAAAWLVLGTPTLMWFLSRHPNSTAYIPAVALAGHLLSLCAYGALSRLSGADVLPATQVYGILGALFAPLWGAAFAMLYRKLSARLT